VNNPIRGRDRSTMLAGGVLVALGVMIGTWMAGPGSTQPAFGAEGPSSSNCLPAITLGRQDMVLLRDQAGIYFLVDAAGTVNPLRVADTDLKNMPGRSLLRAP